LGEVNRQRERDTRKETVGKGKERKGELGKGEGENGN